MTSDAVRLKYDNQCRSGLNAWLTMLLRGSGVHVRRCSHAGLMQHAQIPLNCVVVHRNELGVLERLVWKRMVNDALHVDGHGDFVVPAKGHPENRTHEPRLHTSAGKFLYDVDFDRDRDITIDDLGYRHVAILLHRYLNWRWNIAILRRNDILVGVLHRNIKPQQGY